MQKNSSINHLKKSKIKLSLSFSVLILLILVFFNFVFFIWKYRKATHDDLFILDRWSKVFLSLKYWWEKKAPWLILRHIWFLWFIIQDLKNWKILFKKDESWISEEIISNFWKNWNKEVHINWSCYLVHLSKNKKLWVSIYAFKEAIYWKKDFISDFLQNSLYSILISIIIYFLAFKLISRNLKYVEENLKDMDDFVHNAGHELKTPLAVISSNLQLALKTWDFKELSEESLNEVQKTVLLINWLLSLSSISSNSELDGLNIKTEIEKICSDNSQKLKEKNIKLELNLENFKIKINKEHFYILFSNIFFNSIRYSNEGWKIEISLKSWKLEIKDEWVWILEKNVEKIFDRFYQELEWRESSHWFWIWLSLVKKVADIYSWKLFVKSQKWEWTSFSIKF